MARQAARRLVRRRNRLVGDLGRKICWPGHHLYERTVQRVSLEAVRKAGVTKPATCYSPRHSFATHLLMNGCDIGTVQELHGHQSVKTTMIYIHVLNRGGRGVQSPADLL